MIHEAKVKVPGSEWGAAYPQSEREVQVQPVGNHAAMLQLVNPHVQPYDLDRVEGMVSLSEAEAEGAWQALSKALGKTEVSLVIVNEILDLREELAGMPGDEKYRAGAAYALGNLLERLRLMGAVPKEVS